MDSRTSAAAVYAEREKEIVHVSVRGIIVNLLLVAAKAMIGVLINSVAFLSDALNNLADAFSSVVTIIGAKLAGRAPDKEHPYGYGRIEYLSSMVIGVFILYTGVTSFIDSVQKIINPEKPAYDALSIVIIVAAIAAKLFLGWYFKRQGARVRSDALTASGADATMDAIVSSSILVGAAITIFSGVAVDGWIGAGIALVIVKAGLDVLKTSVSSIIGERTSPEYVQKIRHQIEAFPEVQGCYDLIVHQYGPALSIGSVHVQIADTLTAKDIDKLSRQIETALYAHDGVILTVGVYASNQSSPQASAIHKKLMEITEQYPEVLQMHGFYVDEKTHSVSYDIIVSFDAADRQRIFDEVLDRIRKAFPAYHFSSVMDSDFSD